MPSAAPFAIRPAALDDASTIADFNRAMAIETESLDLDLARLLAGTSAVIEDPTKGFYLVAESAGLVVGQLMITYEWSDWRNGVFWWVQSVYVTPECRGRGIYKALYGEAQARAKQAGNVCGLRLYVEKDNARAKAAYLKSGMSETAYDLYEVDFVIARPD